MNLKLIHGGGEIKRIDNQIREAYKLIDGNKLSIVRLDDKLINSIVKLGFDYTSSSGITFIGNRQVIKCGLLTRTPPPLKYRVPTLIYNYERLPLKKENWDWVVVLMVQPKVDTTIYTKHVRTMSDIEKRLTGEDYHIDNFGIYKKQVKLIDW